MWAEGFRDVRGQLPAIIIRANGHASPLLTGNLRAKVDALLTRFQLHNGVRLDRTT